MLKKKKKWFVNNYRKVHCVNILSRIKAKFFHHKNKERQKYIVPILISRDYFCRKICRRLDGQFSQILRRHDFEAIERSFLQAFSVIGVRYLYEGVCSLAKCLSVQLRDALLRDHVVRVCSRCDNAAAWKGSNANEYH